MAGVGTSASGRTEELLAAFLELAGDLDIHSLLQRFVAVSVSSTGARYGAINIVDELGASTTFVQSGVDEDTVAALGHPPHAAGVLGRIPDEGVLLLEDLTRHPSFRGLPAGHPPMHSFLGAAIRVRGERYGTLYLSEKAGGFTAEDEAVVLALARAAAVAFQNAQLYAIERRRERWLTAGQRITTMLLEGADPEDVLEEIASSARDIDGADTAALVLPGPDGQLLTEIVAGPGRERLLGLDLSDAPLVRRAFDTGDGQVVASFARVPDAHPELRRYGPALLAPMHTGAGDGVGVLVLLRRVGAPAFTDSDLALSRSFAGQAALAFVLAEARHAQSRTALHDERGRIARDLHDLAIQQLLAAGMQVEAARDPHPGQDRTPGQLLEAASTFIESGVRQIRVIVRALDDPGATVPLVDRVQAEVDLACSSLGFPPSLTVTLDGEVLRDDDAGPRLRIDELVSPGRANNLVAVVREGLSNVARHARSRRVDVRLSVRTGADVTVEVEDDGVGVPQAPARASGTKNLAVRAEQSGGRFALVRPASGRGALLQWSAALT